jgi:hypothetical protein
MVFCKKQQPDGLEKPGMLAKENTDKNSLDPLLSTQQNFPRAQETSLAIRP